MRIDLLIRGLLLGLCSIAAFPAFAADDFTVNRMLASQCAQCHGTDGYAVGDMDGLTDESFKDLYEDLTDMQFEDRPEDIMDHQALGYTEDQIRRIALYFAALSGKGGEGEEEEDEKEMSEAEKKALEKLKKRSKKEDEDEDEEDDD